MDILREEFKVHKNMVIKRGVSFVRMVFQSFIRSILWVYIFEEESSQKFGLKVKHGHSLVSVVRLRTVFQFSYDQGYVWIFGEKKVNKSDTGQ